MRNWNLFKRTYCINTWWFLLYLWGIETGDFSQDWPLPKFVFTLPMRNWNYYLMWQCFRLLAVFTLPMRNWNWALGGHRLLCGDVFTLPMRNWNLWWHQHPDPGTHSFYFTYEELKQMGDKIESCLYSVFTLPMRNWNLFLARVSQSYLYRFYFTYEELKRQAAQGHGYGWATFLLYLWGIETCVLDVLHHLW